jgi:hypothetical protein
LGTERRKQVSRANWIAFREKILVSEEGDLILSIPSKDEITAIHSKAVSTGEEEPVRLAFPITEAVIGHTTLDDYLLFLGNFNQVSLMRNESGWLMIFKTFRRGNQKASDWEYTGDNESGVQEAVQIDRKALVLLRNHADFPTWSVSQLRSFLGRDLGA